MELSDQINKISCMIRDGYYSNSIEESLKVLEKGLRQIYQEIMLELSSDEKQKLCEIERKQGNKKFKDLEIGQILGIFIEFDLIEKYCKEKSVTTNVCNRCILNIINAIRVKCTHKDYHSYLEEANFVLATVVIIASELKLISPIQKKEKDNTTVDAKLDKKQSIVLHSNIPKIDAAEFIGREDKIEEVLNWLKSNRAAIISIDGIGGVGKSTLAIEVANRIISQKIFNAVIWVSAKRDILTPDGIRSLEDKSFQNLEDLLDEILRVFKEEDSLKYNLQEKQKQVLKLLKENECVIIIDNLETITDQRIKEFLVARDFPSESKVLITSRKLLGEMEKAIFIKEFTLEETKKFILSQLEFQHYQRSVSEGLIQEIQNHTGGIPLAIKVLIPLIIKGNLNLSNAEKYAKDTEILNFCFDKVYTEILNKTDKKLFCLFSLCPQSISESSLAYISRMDKKDFDISLSNLLNYSLIFNDTDNEDKSDTYYKMLPLTKEFGLTKRSEFPELTKDEVNKQYLKFIQESESNDEYTSSKKGLSINLAEQARRLALEGDIAEAELKFKKSIETDPECDYSLYLYSIFAKEKQDYGHSLRLITKAITICSDNPRYWMEYSYLLEEQGEFKKIEQVLTKALDKTNQNIQILQQLVKIKERLNKMKEAIEIAKKSIIETPDSKGRFINSRFVYAIMEGYWREGAQANRDNIKVEAINYWVKALNEYEELTKKGIVYINPGLEKQEKKIARALGEIYENRDNSLALKYYEKAKYIYAKYPDQINHNADINKRIKYLNGR